MSPNQEHNSTPPRRLALKMPTDDIPPAGSSEDDDGDIDDNPIDDATGQKRWEESPGIAKELKNFAFYEMDPETHPDPEYEGPKSLRTK